MKKRYDIVVKVRDIYDKKSLQQFVSQVIITWATHEGRDSGVEHLNFFNKVISDLLTVNVKIDEEDKALILLSLISQSYDHIVTSILYGKKNRILEEVTSTLISNEIRKRQNQEEQEGSSLVVTGRKGRREGRRGPGSSKACHFYYRESYWKNNCNHQ